MKLKVTPVSRGTTAVVIPEHQDRDYYDDDDEFLSPTSSDDVKSPGDAVEAQHQSQVWNALYGNVRTPSRRKTAPTKANQRSKQGKDKDVDATQDMEKRNDNQGEDRPMRRAAPRTVTANTNTNEFLRRLDQQVETNAKKQERLRAEQEYDAKVDKKRCPSCGNVQNLEQVLKRKNKCMTCGVRYRASMTWREVRHDFLRRNEEFLERKSSRRRQRTSNVKKSPLVWKEVKDCFLKRVEEASKSRHERENKARAKEKENKQRKPWSSRDRSAMNYSLYVTGDASGVPIHVERIIGEKESKISSVPHPYHNANELELRSARKIVAQRLRKLGIN